VENKRLTAVHVGSKRRPKCVPDAWGFSWPSLPWGL